MTVADIKEYIKKQVEKYDEIPDEYQDAKFKQAIADLVIVLGMLDELEPKAKWVKTQVGYYDDDYGYECSNCKEIYCTDYDFEEMPYNYCPNCGARMNDELKENKK